MNVSDFTKMRNRMKARIFRNQICKYLFITGTLISLVFLTVLFMRIFLQGFPYLDWHFLNSLPSRKPEDAGIYTAMNGTLWLIAIVAPVSMILGVGTALYLEEYAKKNKFTTFIQVNIANLAGVPSVVYGLLGLTIFVRALPFRNECFGCRFNNEFIDLTRSDRRGTGSHSLHPELFKGGFLRNGSYQMANNLAGGITGGYSGNFNRNDSRTITGDR